MEAPEECPTAVVLISCGFASGSTEGLVKTRRAGSSPQGLIQGVWAGARCIVTSSQVMLLLLLWEPGFENQIRSAKEGSRG